jgi:hypothetical protein
VRRVKEDIMGVAKRFSIRRNRIHTGLLVLGAAAVVTLAVLAAGAQKEGNCPEIIASLLPKSGSIRGGAYNAAGDMGLGSGAADLPFEHPCPHSGRYTARVTVAVTYYGGEMAEMLKMQGDAANEQTLQNALNELERKDRSPRREKLGGGEIVYITYETECPPNTIDTGQPAPHYPPIPHVELKGVALTANVRLEVRLEGVISPDLAKAAVAEVFENLGKADFSKAK